MHEIASGSVVGGFRVVSLIGEGAMGKVYLAEGVEVQHRVALKLLSPELANDERFRRRFLRESQLAASLDHPHIVRTLAAGEDDGLLYLAMAYVEGSDLRELLRNEGKLEPERALHLVSQAADALDAAHAAGLVHRDVKPANILVTEAREGEHVYVCDFGLARHVSSVSSLTSERGFIGTVDYVSPEQIEGGPVDDRADVYSLGCVLFECIAGVRPFDRESELAVIFAHLNTSPPLLTDLRPELPEVFNVVFATALAKAPGDRFPTCGDLVGAGRAALRGEAVKRRGRSRRLVVALAALGGAAALGAGAFALRATREGHAATLSLEPNGLSLVNAKTHSVMTREGFGEGGISDIAFTGGSAWVLLGDDKGVVRVDLAGRRVGRVLRFPHGNGGRIAAGAGSLWTTADTGPEVIRIDARTGKVSGRFSVGGGAGDGIAYGSGSLWLARGSDVTRVDPRTGRVLRRFPVGGAATRVVFHDGAVWAVSSGNGVVTKIDPIANRITATQKLHGWISDLAAGGGFVWTSITPDGVVFKLNENDLSVQGSEASGPDPERISFGGGKLWIANQEANEVSLLDPDSGKLSELPADESPNLAQYHRGLVWTGAAPLLPSLPPIHGHELRVSMANFFPGADPSTSPGSLNEQIDYATCANLLGYPDSAGPQGIRLRPELAGAMPSVSHHRRTYTFRIRQGIRFSPPSPDRPASLLQPASAVPETVTAETFKHTIERALSPKLGPNAPAAPVASDIVGAAAFRAGKAPHIRGIVAHDDSLSITLVRPAGDFLTRISMPFFCPVPQREPVVPSGLTGAIQSLGPYYMASINGDRIVLLRNPNYVGQRPRNVDRIVFTTGVPTPTAVAQIAAGKVDYLPTDYDAYSMLAPRGTLDRRYGAGSAAARRGGQRYFLEPQPGVNEIVFNMRRPLFRDLRLRRAVNFALDRPALASVWGEPATDGYVPPAIHGFRSPRIYPTSRSDIRTARRLAGRRKRDAVLYFCGDPANRRVADIVRLNLAQIGISISIVQSQGCLHGSDPKAARADLLIWTVFSQERDPAPFVKQALTQGAYGISLGPGPWQERSFRSRLARANELSGAERLAAYRELETELLRAAPFAAYGSPVQPDYFSPKVGCKVVQSAYHFVDLGALCVR
jgi:ABC-type transport system substrate-binding protein/tRNA A-37 threonylcarbamoyl transferase component Bud32/streptogramin lyase